MANVGDIIAKVAAFGVGGWFVENAICGTTRYSTLLSSAQIPFLPIYAANGVVLTAVAPYIEKWPWLARGLTYAALGSGVEYIGCQIDRHFLSSSEQMMRVNPDTLMKLSGGCVNFTRSALWGGMGLVAEKIY